MGCANPQKQLAYSVALVQIASREASTKKRFADFSFKKVFVKLRKNILELYE